MRTININATITVPEAWNDATENERYEWLQFKLGTRGGISPSNILYLEELVIEDFEIDSL